MAATQCARPCTLLVGSLVAVDSSHLFWQFMICSGRVIEDGLNKYHDGKYLGNEGKWQPNILGTCFLQFLSPRHARLLHALTGGCFADHHVVLYCVEWMPVELRDR